MSILPHFTNTSSSYYCDDPIYLNRCDVDFGKNLQFLNERISKLENNKILLYVNMNNIVEISNYILEMVNNKEVLDIVEFKFNNKDGEINYRVIVECFRFTKITNMLDFDYSEDNIKYLEVNFKFKKSSIVDEKDYLKFIRKFKLERISK